MKIEQNRKRIDKVDEKILSLLHQRANIVREIGEIKMRAGISIFDPNREAEIMRRVTTKYMGSLGNDAVTRIYRTILRESRRIQRNLAESGAADQT
jgi:chorismate mutase-like protein